MEPRVKAVIDNQSSDAFEQWEEPTVILLRSGESNMMTGAGNDGGSLAYLKS